jgi:predicted acetyltransferase
MSNFSSLSLVKLEEVALISKVLFLEQLTPSIDIPFGNARTGIDLIEVFSKKLAYWIILVDDVPVGVFGIDVCVQLPQQLQTSTLILKEYRGKGIGPSIKYATVQVFLEHHIPLICLVRESNKPSLRSLGRTFPEITVSEFVQIDAVQFHVFDLSLADMKKVPSEAEQVAVTVNAWLANLISS